MNNKMTRKSVSIGSKLIGEGMPCFISFEPGGTFSDFDAAKIMIEATSASGADAVKFQTFLPGDADRIMGRKDITVGFRTNSGKKQELVYDALKRRELSKEEWIKLAEFTKQKNLLFITAAYFPETVDILPELGVDAIKVSKGDINNVLLIDRIAKTNLPVILDGREKFEDVEKAVKICQENNNEKIIIMHCPSGYPADDSGVHLNALSAIREKFPYPVGFADHSPGDIMNYAAVSMGASMIEKTITTDKTLEQVEHFMSLELDELKDLVKNIRSIEEAMGNSDILQTSRVEESARRSLVAKKDIKSGEKITFELLDFRRPGDMGISCSMGFKIINKIAKNDIPADTFLQLDMFE